MNVPLACGHVGWRDHRLQGRKIEITRGEQKPRESGSSYKARGKAVTDRVANAMPLACDTKDQASVDRGFARQTENEKLGDRCGRVYSTRSGTSREGDCTRGCDVVRSGMDTDGVERGMRGKDGCGDGLCEGILHQAGGIEKRVVLWLE